MACASPYSNKTKRYHLCIAEKYLIPIKHQNSHRKAEHDHIIVFILACDTMENSLMADFNQLSVSNSALV